MKDLWYEIRPYAYLGLACYAISQSADSHVAKFSAAVLLFCAGQIIHWRLTNRRVLQKK